MTLDDAPIDGGPAFPRSGYYPTPPTDPLQPTLLEQATTTLPLSGMSLRAWIAGHTLAALVSAEAEQLHHEHGQEHVRHRVVMTPQAVARRALILADALLAELGTGSLDGSQ